MILQVDVVNGNVISLYGYLEIPNVFYNNSTGFKKFLIDKYNFDKVIIYPITNFKMDERNMTNLSEELVECVKSTKYYPSGMENDYLRRLLSKQRLTQARLH